MAGHRDLKNVQGSGQSLAPAARIASANGTGADGYRFRSALVRFLVGTITDGTHTPKMQDSDDNSTFVDVVAGQQDGAFTNLVTNTPQTVGYRGAKRYLRAATTVAGATTGGVYAAEIVFGDPCR